MKKTRIKSINKIINAIEKHWSWKTFSLVVSVISGFIIIFGFIFNSGSFLHEEFFYKNIEENNINKLYAGTSIKKFIDILGTETFLRESDDGSQTEYVFRKKDYWIQAITDKIGTVLFYSATVCNDFKPVIHIKPTYSTKNVRLGVTSFLSIEGEYGEGSFTYLPPMATNNSYAYLRYYGGNPAKYQTMYFGINDVCLYDADFSFLIDIGGDQVVSEDDKAKFKAGAIINTYGETAPLFNALDRDELKFQIGVDRVQVRVLEEIDNL